MSVDRLWYERQIAYMAARRADATRRGVVANAWRRLLGRRGRVRGNIDSIGPAGISGWVRDAGRPDAAVRVEVALGRRVVLQAPAETYRPDLEEAGLGSGLHGFAIDFTREVLEQALASSESLIVRTATRPSLVLGVFDVGGSFPIRVGDPENAPAPRQLPVQRLSRSVTENGRMLPAARDILARLSGP